MKCENCQRPIINPVDHEWCTYKPQPLPKTKSELAARIRKMVVPIESDNYVAPKIQGELNHQMAKPGAKPPPPSVVKKVQGNPHYKDTGDEEDGYTSLQRRLAEG